MTSITTANFAPHIWYFPSAFGDIRLEQAEGSRETRVIFYSLTPREAEALEGLRRTSLHWRKKWADKETWERLKTEGAFAVGERTENHIVLRAQLPDVATALNKHLNPDRRTLHVVRIGQGKIEEIREEFFAKPEDERQALDAAREIAALPSAQDQYDEEQKAKAEAKEEKEPPHRREPKPTPAAKPETALATTEKPKTPAVTKVTTVKEPIRGCPAPDFAAIRRRASRVLKAFLTPAQVEDFERYNRFIVKGADTGHQYMVTSRNAPDQLNRFGGRTVFDLTDGRALCVHDWDVPAEEEMLSLACLLQLPGREGWVRTLPDAHLRHRHA